jgi:DNA-binding transcriptional LysR family regulator
VIELVMTNRVQDLLRREADIAVRMTPPRQEQLIARRVGAVALGLYAHRDYLERRGTPRTLAELAGHSLIGYDEETAFTRAARKSFPAWKREAFALRTDSDLGHLALVRAGCGIGAFQVALARREPALTRVLPRQMKLQLDTWITMHEDLRNSPRCKTVFDALVKGIAAHAAG